MNKLQEAEDIYMKALKIKREYYKEVPHYTIADILYNLGLLYWKYENYK